MSFSLLKSGSLLHKVPPPPCARQHCEQPGAELCAGRTSPGDWGSMTRTTRRRATTCWHTGPTLTNRQPGQRLRHGNRRAAGAGAGAGTLVAASRARVLWRRGARTGGTGRRLSLRPTLPAGPARPGLAGAGAAGTVLLIVQGLGLRREPGVGEQGAGPGRRRRPQSSSSSSSSSTTKPPARTTTTTSVTSTQSSASGTKVSTGSGPSRLRWLAVGHQPRQRYRRVGSTCSESCSGRSRPPRGEQQLGSAAPRLEGRRKLGLGLGLGLGAEVGLTCSVTFSEGRRRRHLRVESSNGSSQRVLGAG